MRHRPSGTFAFDAPGLIAAEGAHPIVRGEAVNTATTYGYDAVTMMQETKTTLCQVARITA